MKVANYCGKPLQRTSAGVDIFFSIIILYLVLVSFAFIFCQGSIPRSKYMTTQPIDSTSSLLDCYIPICVLILAYLAVPVNYLPYLYGICLSEVIKIVTIFDIFFGKPKINNVEQMCVIIKPQQKIIRLDITMDNLSFMQILNTFHHLISEYQ